MQVVNPNAQPTQAAPDRLLPIDETCIRAGRVSKSTLHGWIRDKYFPAPIPLNPSGSRVAFLESQVNAWIQERARRAAELGAAGRAKSPNPRARAAQ